MVEQNGGRTVLPTPQTTLPARPNTGPQVSSPTAEAHGERKSRVTHRLLLRNWRVRWRLLALVVIPTVAAIVLGIVRIQAAQGTAANFARVDQLAALGQDVTALTNAVEDERDLTAGVLAARQSGDAQEANSLAATLKNQYNTTDARLATVRSQAAQIGPAFPAVARTDLTSALNAVSGLPDLRGLATSQISALPMITNYSQVTAALIAFDNDIAAGNSSAQLAQTVSSLGSLAQMEDQASQQRAILYAALIQRQFGLGGLQALIAAQSNQASDLATFQATAANLPASGETSSGSPTLTEVQQFNDVVAGAGVDNAQATELDAIDLGNARNGTGVVVNPSGGPNGWFSDMSATLSDIRAVENNVLTSVSAQANAQHQSSETSEKVTAVIVLLLLLLVLGVTVIVARSMISPLRRLRTDALDVASRRLPDVVRRLSESEDGNESGEKITIEPIGVDSTDEIGEVARAFDQVHREAVRLAGDEAILRANLNAMFINLSRRSQTLIERQLGIIDVLEQSEQDPDRLSNLFRLDHLATRMRRNSENLLVLAGHETPRKWSQPVPLVDVLRAAISEIEQYERITLSVQPGIVVSGRAASDVVHLVAELVENATTYSPNETQVLLTAQHVSSGGVLLDISDNGLGIPEEELAYANWRLDNPPVVDVAVSRRMGLFVVGRLASRHGIRVRLKSSGGGGVSALIWLPDAVTESDMPPLGMPRRRLDGNGYGPNGGAMTRGATGPQPVIPEPRRSLSRAQAGAGPIPRVEPNEPSWTSFTPPQNPVSPAAGQPFVSPPVSPQMAPPASPQMAPPVSPPPAPPQESPSVVLPSAAPLAQRRVPRGDTGPLPIYDAVESDWFRRGGKPINGGAAPAVRVSAASGTEEPDTEQWTSPADDGFRAAQAAASPTVGETTTAGLPKRVPSANLVPGSIGGQADGQGGSGSGNGADAARAESQWAAAPVNRSPEDARSRMAGLQRGSREGRAAAPPSYWTDES